MSNDTEIAAPGTTLNPHSALEQMLASCLPPLRRWVSARLPDAVRGAIDAEDIVQDAVLKTLGRLPRVQFADAEALAAYMRQALRNRLCDLYRESHRRPALEPLDESMCRREESPLDRLLREETVLKVRGALRRLPPATSRAVVLRIVAGRSFANVARAVDRPSPDAARVAVRRALDQLGKTMVRATLAPPSRTSRPAA